MKASEIPGDVRLGVLARDGYQCWRCRKNIARGVYSLHHRQGRRVINPHRYSNLITLCGTGTTGCHGWVTHHPQASFDLGLSVRRLGDVDTRLVPIHVTQTWVLDDHGMRIPLGINERGLTAEQWLAEGLVEARYPSIFIGDHAGTEPIGRPVAVAPTRR